MKLYKITGLKYGDPTPDSEWHIRGVQLSKHELPKTVYVVTDEPTEITKIIEDEIGYEVEASKVHAIDQPVFVREVLGSS